MALDKSIVKSGSTEQRVFDYQPKDLSMQISPAAIDFVHDETARKSDFIISNLAAQQSGVAKMEHARSQGIIDQQVLEKLKDVQEQAYKQAYDLGQIDGTNKAFEDQKAALIERLKLLDQTLQTLEKIKMTLLAENEAKFVELTFQIAKKLALRDLSEHRETIVNLLRSVVGDLQQEQILSMRVSEADFTTLEDLQKRADCPIEALKKIKLNVDATVASGGCLIEVTHGEVDLQVADRVERVWQSVEKQILLNTKVE